MIPELLQDEHICSLKNTENFTKPMFEQKSTSSPQLTNSCKTDLKKIYLQLIFEITAAITHP